MSVEPGRRFGTFEVVGRLGAGGMPAEGGPARQVTTGSDWRYPNSFSPDGRLLVTAGHKGQPFVASTVVNFCQGAVSYYLVVHFPTTE